MAEMFHQGSRALQDRFDTRRLADRIEEKLVSDTISRHDAAFIQAMDMFFIATADAGKRAEWSRDYLPAADPARDPGSPVRPA
jgi:hypothetical protein